MSSNFSYFQELNTAFIHNENECIISKPILVYLPKKPVNGRKINIYNHTDKLITINNNSKLDLMYSSFYAPYGSHTIQLENNRMMSATFLVKNAKLGQWLITIN